MPIYEYRCQDCDHEFERMQKFSDPPVEACPACAGAVQKLISRSAFHLKGSGWYVTDYARNGGQNGKSRTESSSEGGGSTSGTSKGGGDAKAAADTSSSTSSETSKSASSPSTSAA
jgi:putative FmdB family regulatory protein